jgi:uncharacterized protein YutE (UPF0331/DUF86 family)
VDDVILNKAQSIERCLNRVREEYAAAQPNLETDYTRQDAIILNLQRACEAVIDMGLRVIRIKKLPVPQASRDIFKILQDANIISENVSTNMQKMIGFRNIAVHEYISINLIILCAIIENHLQDISEFVKSLIKL